MFLQGALNLLPQKIQLGLQFRLAKSNQSVRSTITAKSGHTCGVSFYEKIWKQYSPVQSAYSAHKVESNPLARHIESRLPAVSANFTETEEFEDGADFLLSAFVTCFDPCSLDSFRYVAHGFGMSKSQLETIIRGWSTARYQTLTHIITTVDR